MTYIWESTLFLFFVFCFVLWNSVFWPHHFWCRNIIGVGFVEWSKLKVLMYVIYCLYKSAYLVNLSKLKFWANRLIKTAAENTAHFIYQLPLSLFKHFFIRCLLCGRVPALEHFIWLDRGILLQLIAFSLWTLTMKLLYSWLLVSLVDIVGLPFWYICFTPPLYYLFLPLPFSL